MSNRVMVTRELANKLTTEKMNHLNYKRNERPVQNRRTEIVGIIGTTRRLARTLHDMDSVRELIRLEQYAKNVFTHEDLRLIKKDAIEMKRYFVKVEKSRMDFDALKAPVESKFDLARMPKADEKYF